MPASQSTFVTGALVNGLATCTATFFTNPLEVTKTRFQLQGELGATQRAYSSVLQAARHIVSTEGWHGLQKGLVAAWGYQLVGNGVRLSTYDQIKGAAGRPLTFPETLAAAAGAGCVGTLAGQPFYLVKVRLQAFAPATQIGYRQHEYKSLSDGLRQILFRDGGGDVRALWQGLSGTLGRSVVASSVQLSSFDYCKNFFLRLGLCREPRGKDDRLGLLWLTVCAALSTGVVTTTVMEPFDVAATRLCNQAAASAVEVDTCVRPYAGLLDALQKTVRAEGALALFKGWRSSYLRIGPHTVLMFVFVEQFKALLGVS